jgi:hypothetical protein
VSAPLDGNGGSPTNCPTTACDGPVLTVGSDVYLVLEDLTIENGYSTMAGVGGGGVLNGTGSVLTITDSAFSDDRSVFYGGAVDNGSEGGSGTVSITDSTFNGNHSDDGGAVDNGDDGGSGTVSITGSTFTGNSADNGGAVDNADGVGSGTVTISDSTFSGDTAVAAGGELNNSDDQGNGVLVVSGSTLAAGDSDSDITGGDNVGTGDVFVAGDVFVTGCQQTAGTWTDQGYNVGANASCFKGGAGDVNAGSATALGLGSLASNGGPTETMAIGTTSPAFGIIMDPTSVSLNGQGVALCPTTDQRGDPRPGVGKLACDAGAFEANSDPTSMSVVCQPGAVLTGAAASCIATATDTAASGASVPTGSVQFVSSPTSGSFAAGGACTLTAASSTSASCAVQFAPAAAGAYTITAAYGGDRTHAPGSGDGALSASTPEVVSASTPEGQLSVGHVKVSGTTASVPLLCTGSGPCTVKLTISVLETKRGGRLVAVTATTIKKTLVIAKKSLTLDAGKHETVKLTLDDTGNGLLAQHHPLKTKLKITNYDSTVANPTISFKQTPKKR